MKLDDEKLKRILQDDMNKEAEQILEAVEKDPLARDAVAPEGIYDKVMQQIKEHEAKQQTPDNEAMLSAEQKELIRLGKIYKKKRSMRKYYVAGFAAVMAMAIGLTSFGGPKKVFTEVKRFVSGKSQVVTNTNDGDFLEEISSEEEAYQEIEDKFGFYPVRMYYLPDGMDFVEAVVDEKKQSAHLCYLDSEDRSISYRIVTNYRTGSMGMDVEDKLLQEYEYVQDEITMKVKEFLVEEEEIRRWEVSFVYKEHHYMLMLMGLEEGEINKILKNLEKF